MSRSRRAPRAVTMGRPPVRFSLFDGSRTSESWVMKQLKLPGSTAVRRLTERFARNICAFLVPLINAEPAYADVVRLELKEFAESDRPQFLTFVEYANRGTLHWFVSQLANAPGGPPEFLLE